MEFEFPYCEEYNNELYTDVMQHVKIMESTAEKVGIPLEELINFFYKGKMKLDLIKEQEEVLSDYVGK